MSIAAFQAVDPVLIPSQLSGPTLGFPCSSAGRESACNVGDLGSFPGLGISPGGVHGNPLQYSCLENPMDREAWRATVHGSHRVGHHGSNLAHIHTNGLDVDW